MSINKLAYNGSSKILIALVSTVNALIDGGGGGGGGSTVSWNEVVTTGTKIAEITIDGNLTGVYAPNPTDVDVNVIVSTGTKIATISIDNVDYDLYAPSGGGGSSSIATLTDVALNNLANGQILKYNSSTSKWENSNESGGGGGGNVRTYYVQNGRISDGPNRQFLTANLTTPLVEGSDYVMVFKNSSGGQVVAKMLFDYATDFTINDFDTRCSIGNIDLTITSTTIATTDYSGPWQDIYIDVYRNAGSVGVVGTDILYTGKESQYNSDSSDTPMEFDIRSLGTDFSTYLSTSDYKTFTVLRDFACVVTYGIEQDPNLSSSNIPNCTFYVNNVPTFRVVPPSSSSGSNKVATGTMIFFAGDTFFWGSDDSRGYAVRLGQIDILTGYDLSGYTKPSF